MVRKKKNKSALEEKEGIDSPPSISQIAATELKKKRQISPTVAQLSEDIIKGNITALSRGITLVESTSKRHQIKANELLTNCLPHSNTSIRLGITGVPGVGKSTFIERLGILLTKKGKKVAVLAVDPSSSVSKGSILGDKTRMEELVKEPLAFIRPSASGDSLGGVARKTRESIILCEAAGYEVIIIETVGVGQSETAVHSMTDFFLLLKLAGAGDELQGIKRGIIEMADSIIIHKADGDNLKAAQLARLEFNRALHLYPAKDSGWVPKTMIASALNNEGITELWDLVSGYTTEMKKNSYFEKRRMAQNKFWLHQTIENQLRQNFFQNKVVQQELEKQLKLVEENKTTPFNAAEILLQLANSQPT